MNEEAINDYQEDRGERQKLIKNEDQKNQNSKRFYNILIELYNLPLQNQILVFFFMMYILYLIFIIVMKLTKLDDLNLEISDMTYYSSVGKEYLSNISDTYLNIHSLSFNSHMTHFTKGINFLNIYSRELNRINLTYHDANSSFNYDFDNLLYLENLYTDSDFIDSRRFSYLIKSNFSYEIFSKYNPKITGLNQRLEFQGFNNDILFPMLFVLLPNLIQSAEEHKIRLETVDFISSSFLENKTQKFECDNKQKAIYFTFPKYNLEYENFNLIDEIIDPHSVCEKDIKGNFLMTFSNQSLNYYNIAEKIFLLNNTIESKKFLNQFQRLEDDQKRSNYFSYLSMQKFNNSPKTQILSFIFNIYNDFEDTNYENSFFNHYSVLYFNDNLIGNKEYPFPNTDNINTSLNYNIINAKSIIITIPQFLESLYVYGFNSTIYYQEYSDDQKAIINANDIFGYGNNSKIINSYFDQDAKIFSLIAFFSTQVRELNSIGKSTCDNYSYNISDFGYEFSEENCFSNLCFFNSCVGTEYFFDSVKYLEDKLDCRCLPLFCGDYLKKKINDSYAKISINSNNSSSVRITQQDWNNYNIYRELNETLSMNNFNLNFFNKSIIHNGLKCNINFKKKTYFPEENIYTLDSNRESFYQLNLMISEKPFTNDGIYVVSYLVDLNEFVYKLYSEFFKKVEDLNKKIFICYSVMIVLFSFVCLKKFFNKLNDFKERIIELNENRILKLINKQTEKKNYIKLKKQNSFNKENRENEDVFPSESLSLTHGNLVDIEKIEVEEDELEDIKKLILLNINKFCISFTNKVVFHEKSEIFIKYINKLKKDIMIKINFDNNGFSKKIINDYFSKSLLDYFVIEKIAGLDNSDEEKVYIKEFKEIRNIIKDYEKDKNAIYRDFSCLLLIELLSTEIDLKNIFTNFNYKDPLSLDSKFDLYTLIEKYLEDDSQNICESCDLQKMQNFVTFYIESIVFKWNMELQKRIFNEYYFDLFQE